MADDTIHILDPKMGIQGPIDPDLLCQDTNCPKCWRPAKCKICNIPQCMFPNAKDEHFGFPPSKFANKKVRRSGKKASPVKKSRRSGKKVRSATKSRRSGKKVRSATKSRRSGKKVCSAIKKL